MPNRLMAKGGGGGKALVRQSVKRDSDLIKHSPLIATESAFSYATNHNHGRSSTYVRSAWPALTGHFKAASALQQRCAMIAVKALGLFTHPIHSSPNPTSSDPGHLGTTGKKECPNRRQSKSETDATL